MFTKKVQFFTNDNVKTFIPMGKPHFHTCVNGSKHNEFYPLGLLQEEIFPGLTSFPVPHWGFVPMGEF